MTNLFQIEDTWIAGKLRQALADLFGSRAQYYRYRDGRYPITPDLQEQIAALFRQFGLHCEPQYDELVQQYCGRCEWHRGL